MKISIWVYSITPGSGLSKYICSLAHILGGSGNELSVVTTHTEDAEFERAELTKVGIKEYYSLAKYGKWSKYYQTTKLLHKLSPDVIINNYNAVVQYVLPFIPKKCKVIHILHSNTPDFYRVGSINGNLTHGWIGPTPEMAQYFNDYTKNKYKKRVVVIPHGVEYGNPQQVAGNRKELTFVGVLYEHKGVKCLPPIIHELKKRGLDFYFNIIGKGILEDWLKGELRKEIEEGVVTFTGVIPHDEVYKYLSKTDVFVYPTHIDAFGLVIAEAMMNGAVPVVSLLKGITDALVDNNKNGFLPSEDDIDTFCNCIEKLITNEALLTQFKQDAIRKAEKCFSLDTMRKNYLDYLNQVVK